MGRGFDKSQRKDSPPLQGRGRGWGLSVARIAELHGHAVDMRRNATAPEQRLWGYLRAAQLDGHKFRRQSTIGRHIVDFVCAKKGLIVEVDGDTHIADGADERRDATLAAMGYRIVRVTNDDVMKNVDGVLESLRLILAGAPDRRHSPHPNPSPEGEGLSEEHDAQD
jgi:very-short-patch-repair endonuclease